MKQLVYSIVILFSVSFCKKKSNSIPNNSISVNVNKDITGTWVLYKYQVQSSNTLISKSDTLIFKENNNYTYNNISAKYYIDNINTYNSCRFILYNTTFGNITAIVPDNFETAKEINGVLFSPYLSSSTGGYLLWFKKI